MALLYYFKRYNAVKKYVSKREIGGPKPSDLAGQFRSLDEYAVRNVFVGGFPTYNVFQNREGEVVYEIILLNENARIKKRNL